MDFDFFQRQIERLKETFGPQHYKDERVKLLWRDVSQLKNDWFASIVSEFIYCSPKAPLGDEFRVKIGEERQKEWSDKLAKDTFDDFDPHKSTCIYCRDVGTLVHEGYAYRCYCNAGKKRAEKYPYFKPTY
jgi:hypothetical protein